jgi:hypothetical protein
VTGASQNYSTYGKYGNYSGDGYGIQDRYGLNDSSGEMSSSEDDGVESKLESQESSVRYSYLYFRI